jgi:hypothetical protein
MPACPNNVGLTVFGGGLKHKRCTERYDKLQPGFHRSSLHNESPTPLYGL